MRIVVLNGPKTAYTVFAIVCAIVIVYVGFLKKDEAVVASGEAVKTSYVAIIIDDFGNGTDGTKEFLYMDIPYTGAVMPGMPYTDEESRQLYESGKDVILHMPMEPHSGKSEWLGEKALKNNLSAEQAKTNIEDSLLEINYCIGINNHMGSKVMENENLVRQVFEVASDRDLIVIDSKTTNKSAAKELSKEYNVVFLERDVFLDGTKDIRTIEKNLRKAGDVAQDNGYAIAIGHVGQEGGKATAQAIKNLKSEFAQKGIKFVTISELVKLINDNAINDIK